MWSLFFDYFVEEGVIEVHLYIYTLSSCIYILVSSYACMVIFFFLHDAEYGYISILFHHGSVLMDGNGNFEYYGGEVYLWQNVDTNRISYLEIVDEMKKQGYGEISKMAYFIPGLSKSGRIRYVKKYSDKDVMEMINWDDNGDIHVFIGGVLEIGSEEENEPVLEIQQMQSTPKEKLVVNDAITHNNVKSDYENNVMGNGNEGKSEDDDVNQSEHGSDSNDYE